MISLSFRKLNPREKMCEKSLQTVWKWTLFQFKSNSVYWLTIVSGSMAAVAASEASVRIGCLAHLFLTGRRHITHQNNSTKYWVCECSTTMPNHHTSSRIITSTVHHTSANNFIKAHLNKSTVTAAQLGVFKWSWHVLDSLHYLAWPWWLQGVSKLPPRKRVSTCLPDIYTPEAAEETASAASWSE